MDRIHIRPFDVEAEDMLGDAAVIVGDDHPLLGVPDDSILIILLEVGNLQRLSRLLAVRKGAPSLSSSYG